MGKSTILKYSVSCQITPENKPRIFGGISIIDVRNGVFLFQMIKKNRLLENPNKIISAIKIIRRLPIVEHLPADGSTPIIIIKDIDQYSPKKPKIHNFPRQIRGNYSTVSTGTGGRSVTGRRWQKFMPALLVPCLYDLFIPVLMREWNGSIPFHHNGS